MTHPLVGGLVGEAKIAAFHAEADSLMCRIARLVPRSKLTLVIRNPAKPDGSQDILLTDDEIPDVVKALELLSKRPARGPQKRLEPK